jgi:hypothetical protein
VNHKRPAAAADGRHRRWGSSNRGSGSRRSSWLADDQLALLYDEVQVVDAQGEFVGKLHDVCTLKRLLDGVHQKRRGDRAIGSHDEAEVRSSRITETDEPEVARRAWWRARAIAP